jgi:tRNA nucleotidyltransferase (CCA-adding enzyme)
VKTNLHDTETIIAKGLQLCEPAATERARIAGIAEKARALVEKQISSLEEVVGVVFGGSFAKGTWIKGDADVDIFVKIRFSVSMDRFEELGRHIGLEALKAHQPRLRYSDHPYVEAFVNNVRVNVVPCYDVEQGKWQSAADRSPFHTEYVTKNLEGEKRNQARLLKSFFKSAGIYGAEISTGGFSGYVSEVLVHKYGSFEAVLQGAADLQERQVIAVGDNYDEDIVKGFHSPLIIIDPVDPRRNLGTAISPESVAKFVLAARAFLEKPSLRFFITNGKKPRSPLLMLARNVLVVEFAHKERSPDIVWGQLKRSLKAITKQLEIADFVVLRTSCATDEKTSAAMALLLESVTLPLYAKRKGPEVYRREDTASFLANFKNKPHVTWVDGEMRIAALVDRKVTDARKLVGSVFRDHVVSSGISKDLLAHKSRLRIYIGSDKRFTKLAKEAVDEIVSTEHFIFR